MIRFTFVQKDPIPNLATMHLSAVLKDGGFDAQVVVAPAHRALLKTILRTEPDVVCFSATTGQHLWQMGVARAVKQARPEVMTLMGGPHPTFYAKALEEAEGIDAICMGEGEDAILELAQALSAGEEPYDIKNLGFKLDDEIIVNPMRPTIQDLDRLPFMDRSIYDHYDFIRKRRMISTMSVRGCPYKCTFCFNVTLQEMYRGKGKYVRSKTPEYQIRELERDIARYPWVNQVGFADDIFILNYRGWGKEFLKLYAERVRLPFSCLLRADLVTPEVVQSLKEANCAVIKIGIESGEEELRRGVLKKGRLGNAEMREAGRLIKDAGIKLYTFNIVGIPGETMEMAEKTARLNIDMGADHAWASICQPYPGTHLEDIALAEGYLEPGQAEKDFEYTYFISTPLKLEQKRELCNFQKLLPLGVSYPWMLPIIRRAVKLPPNRGFEMIFKAHYAMGLLKTNQINLRDAARLVPLTQGYWVDEDPHQHTQQA